MSPFEYIDYREFLAAACGQPEATRGFQATLARAAGCQSSYFSQVLRGKTHLTEDQAVGMAVPLGLTEAALDHFLLLLRLAKAGTPKLREYLLKAISKSKKAQSNLSERVDADRLIQSEEDLGKYFCSWTPSAVHLLTSSSINTSDKIADRLGISVSKTVAILELLKNMGFVEKKGEKWLYKGGAIHIPKDSPWQTPLQMNRRQLALRSIAVEPDEAVHFSSIFTLDKKDAEDLQKLIGNFVEKSHKVIHKSGTEELYCMCLDFFAVV